MHDLLVIGGGPAGASAASWAAQHGLDVVVVERSRAPRETAGTDALTPRAVDQLHAMGLGAALRRFHRIDGIRAVAHRRAVEVTWPAHPELPNFGYVANRTVLDALVLDAATVRGAALRRGVEAMAPLTRNGQVLGATIRDRNSGEVSEVLARWVIIADGAASRVGRALGARRDKSYAHGLAVGAPFASMHHDQPWIERALDVRDRNGATLPGYGWVFPRGDGTVTVGVGLVSTLHERRRDDATQLLDTFTASVASRWSLDPGAPLAAPTGGRLPLGGVITPKVGPNWVLVGDAAGSINPLNGDGLDYAYETGRLAADLVAEAATTNNGLALHAYPELYDAHFRQSFEIARVFTRLIASPAILRQLTRVVIHSRSLLDWSVRILTNLLRPDEIGPAEAASRALAALARLVPEGAVSARG